MSSGRALVEGHCLGPFAGGIRTDTVRSAPDPRVGHGLGRATRPTGLGGLLDALRKALKAGKRLNRATFDGSHNNEIFETA